MDSAAAPDHSPTPKSQSSSAHLYRPSALDRSWASCRILEVVGPLHGLDMTALESALKAIDASTPTPRTAIEPRLSEPQWPYLPPTRAWSIDSLAATDNDLDRLLTDLGHRSGERYPTEVYLIGEEYLAVEYPHAVGDGHYGVNLLVALLNSEITTLGPDLPLHAVWPALWAHFRSHPRRITQLYRLRRNQLRKPSPGPSVRRNVTDWQDSRQLALGHLDSRRFTELQDWVATYAAGATRAGVMSALWLAALRSQGITVDDRVTVLVNCRRYLPADQRAGVGNFAVGVPLHIGSLGPLEVTKLVREVTDSGWPLAVIAMGELRASLRRGTLRPATTGTSISDRLRLSVSDMGKLPFDQLPWVPGRPRQATAFLNLDGPDAITMLLWTSATNAPSRSPTAQRPHHRTKLRLRST